MMPQDCLFGINDLCVVFDDVYWYAITMPYRTDKEMM